MKSKSNGFFFSMWSKRERNYEKNRLVQGAVALLSFLCSALVFSFCREILQIADTPAWCVMGFCCYTFLAFGFALTEKGSILFRRNDHRPWPKILLGHLGFVGALALYLATASLLRPYLPAQFMSPNRHGESWFSGTAWVIGFILLMVETEWLTGQGRRSKKKRQTGKLDRFGNKI